MSLGSMTLLGSVARKYLCYILSKRLGPEPSLHYTKRRSRTASEIFSTIGQFRRGSAANLNNVNNGSPAYLTDRNISGNTLLAHSPLHDNQGERGPLAPLLYSQTETVETPVVRFFLFFFTSWRYSSNAVNYIGHAISNFEVFSYLSHHIYFRSTHCLQYFKHTLSKRAEILASKIDLDDVAIDPAPFQLVKGTSLYKLREAFSNIYSRGAVPIRPRTRTLSSFRMNQTSNENGTEDGTDDSGQISIVVPPRVERNSS
uniref:Uncharacterized protein n=1 Tax=Heterorhabditis bacteriophora TaxID=37862 RepID=A0A1I7XQT6_HETBA